MPEVVLHIGLHKTATRFLQRALFANLDSDRFLFNPQPLFHDLRQAVRHPGDVTWARRAEAAADRAREQAGDRTIVISDPSISGDMYSSHVDYRENRDLVHRLFPNATIVYFVRRQADWLHSAYRQALVKGPGMPIEFFLNFREGEFRDREARRIGNCRNVNALDLRFLEIYRAYADAFGPRQVYLLRQEDLRERPHDVYRRVAEALGVAELEQERGKVSSNRSFSALAIHLFFPGVHRHPRPGRSIEDAPRWRQRLHRRLTKYRTGLIRHGFDRLIYRDWDLLARHGMRRRLEAHYAPEYRVLTDISAAVLDEGPGPRARALADRSAAS